MLNEEQKKVTVHGVEGGNTQSTGKISVLGLTTEKFSSFV